MSEEKVNHPAHYGGKDNPYECILVIEAWELGFNLGNCVKYIRRAGKKGDRLEDLKKALWYLNREIENEEKLQKGPVVSSPVHTKQTFCPRCRVIQCFEEFENGLRCAGCNLPWPHSADLENK
jgi:Protein of unknwon function (DUF3310)